MRGCSKQVGAVFLTLALGLGAPIASASVVEKSARSVSVERRVGPQLALELRRRGIASGAPILVRIFKDSSELELWMEGRRGKYVLFKTYDICSYSGKLGPKLEQGDRQSPEGFYQVTPGLMNPNSAFHLSFNIGYPNAYDRARGRTGGSIMVHGDCISVGCYAMTDEMVEEIYTLASWSLDKEPDKGFPVHVFPFRMTDRAMHRHRTSDWIDFWRNLKQGYDFFEKEKRPPVVAVAKYRYVFAPDTVISPPNIGAPTRTAMRSKAAAPEPVIAKVQQPPRKSKKVKKTRRKSKWVSDDFYEDQD